VENFCSECGRPFRNNHSGLGRLGGNRAGNPERQRPDNR
jgi:hypothetical protein